MDTTIRLQLTDDAVKILLSHAVTDILERYMEKQIGLEIEKMKMNRKDKE